jgi:hypothetical protein
MSTTVRDASLTTARRRQLATYAWRNSVGLYANPTTTKEEQAPSSWRQAGPSESVPLNVYIGAQLVGQTPGACPCDGSGVGPTLQGYSKNSPGC